MDIVEFINKHNRYSTTETKWEEFNNDLRMLLAEQQVNLISSNVPVIKSLPCTMCKGTGKVIGCHDVEEFYKD